MPSLSPVPPPSSHDHDFIIHFNHISFIDLSILHDERRLGFSYTTFRVVLLDIKLLHVLVPGTKFAEAPCHVEKKKTFLVQ